MVTNYPQQLAAAAEITYEKTSQVLAHGLGRFGQLMCGMRGHDSILQFEGKRMLMRCVSCGHDTPGWEINGRAPRRRFEGDAHHHALKPQLVLRKSA